MRSISQGMRGISQGMRGISQGMQFLSIAAIRKYITLQTPFST
jgi:hypothetical protein